MCGRMERIGVSHMHPYLMQYLTLLCQYSSSRRLPSRLFSSTRRLFGSSAPAASAPVTPTHGSNPSISSVTSRFASSHAASSSVTSLASISSASGATEGGVTQQRRLAEFATVLGDYKLAITVWETLRKDSKGGSVSISSVVLSSIYAHPIFRMFCLS